MLLPLPFAPNDWAAADSARLSSSVCSLQSQAYHKFVITGSKATARRCRTSGAARLAQRQVAAAGLLAGAGFALSFPRHVFGQAVTLLGKRRRFCQGWRSHRAERGVPLTGSQA